MVITSIKHTAVLLAAFTALAAVQAEAAVVGYWRMEVDDNASATAYSIANEVAGGSALTGSSGQVIALAGGGESFFPIIPQTNATNTNGLDGLANINGTVSDYAALDTTSITVEMFVRTNEGTATLINRGFTSGTDGFIIDRPNDLRVRYVVDVGGTATNVTLDASPAVNLGGSWAHIAWTYDETTGVGGLYLNGVLQDSATVAAGSPLIQDDDSNISIGQGFDGGNLQNGNALIDEVRISNTALNPNQFLNLPEPSTYAVFGGLALCFGIAGWWRKRRQQAA